VADRPQDFLSVAEVAGDALGGSAAAVAASAAVGGGGGRGGGSSGCCGGGGRPRRTRSLPLAAHVFGSAR